MGEAGVERRAGAPVRAACGQGDVAPGLLFAIACETVYVVVTVAAVTVVSTAAGMVMSTGGGHRYVGYGDGGA